MYQFMPHYPTAIGYTNMLKPRIELLVTSSFQSNNHFINLHLQNINEELLQDILGVVKRMQELVENAGGNSVVRQSDKQGNTSVSNKPQRQDHGVPKDNDG